MTCHPIPRGFICLAPEPVLIGRWLVEVHRYLGPIVLRRNGDPRVRQPGPGSPFWAAFARWERRHSRAHADENGAGGGA